MGSSETCMFCLEDLKAQESSSNPIGCHCSYKSHPSCLQTWFEQKNQYECPICHSVSIPNPIHATNNPIQVIVVRREQSNMLEDINMSNQKCMGWCCMGMIVWTIVVNIIDLVLRS